MGGTRNAQVMHYFCSSAYYDSSLKMLFRVQLRKFQSKRSAQNVPSGFEGTNKREGGTSVINIE